MKRPEGMSYDDYKLYRKRIKEIQDEKKKGEFIRKVENGNRKARRAMTRMLKKKYNVK